MDSLPPVKFNQSDTKLSCNVMLGRSECQNIKTRAHSSPRDLNSEEIKFESEFPNVLISMRYILWVTRI